MYTFRFTGPLLYKNIIHVHLNESQKKKKNVPYLKQMEAQETQ